MRDVSDERILSIDKRHAKNIEKTTTARRVVCGYTVYDGAFSTSRRDLNKRHVTIGLAVGNRDGIPRT